MLKHDNTTDKLPQKVYDIVALVWGLLEATCFFIVPDVFISYRTLTSFRVAIRACLFALAGAILGGILMYTWASHSPQALKLVQATPAVSSAMVTTTSYEYQAHGPAAILVAPLRVTPYKLYAVLAHSSGIGLASFVTFSIVARLWRFVAVALITSLLSRLLSGFVSYKWRVALVCLVWLSFYSLYFIHNGF